MEVRRADALADKNGPEAQRLEHLMSRVLTKRIVSEGEVSRRWARRMPCLNAGVGLYCVDPACANFERDFSDYVAVPRERPGACP